MFGNLSIRSKLIPLLAVPVAGSLLLGVAGVAGGFGERARAAEEARGAVVAAQAVAAAHELQEERVRAVAWLAGGGHDALVDALIGAARGLAAHLDAPAPSRTARLLLAVSAAKETTGQERTLLAALPPTPQTSSTSQTPATSRTPGVRDPNPPIPRPPNREGTRRREARDRLSTPPAQPPGPRPGPARPGPWPRPRPPRPGLRPPGPGRRTTRCCGSGRWRGRRWPVGS